MKVFIWLKNLLISINLFIFLYKSCLRISYIILGSEKYLYYILILFTIKCFFSHFLVKLFFFFLKAAILYILHSLGQNALSYFFDFFRLLSIVFLIIGVIYFFINFKAFFKGMLRLYKLIESARAVGFIDIPTAEQIAKTAEEVLDIAFKLFCIVIVILQFITVMRWLASAKALFLYVIKYNLKWL